MRRAIVVTMVMVMAACGVAVTAQVPRVPRNAVIFIEATDPPEFGAALAAAIQKKKVPVLVTTMREKATYIMTAQEDIEKSGTGERVARLIVGAWGNGNKADRNVVVTNADGIVVFAYNTTKGRLQSAAEGVAKHLKNHIDGK